MTPRDQIAHLYRRFGLGASWREVESALPLGLDGAIRGLIESPPEFDFPPSPWEFIWYKQVDPDAAAEYFRRWWLLRMLTTADPLQERMTLFWHSHFAVSQEKVQFGPMMLDYLMAIQRSATGRFRDLLGAVVTTPALLEYLDMNRSLKGRPNENLPRELMELYTLGVGNYTEADVQAAARALTGWGYINTFFELPGTNRTKIEEAIRDDRPFAAFAPMPAMHDGGEKDFLGRRGAYSSEDVLDILARHPATARHIVGKLWAYFAYPNPDPATLETSVAAFTSSDGNIRATLAAIARTPEFYSPRCVRQKMKDPVDWTVGTMRAAGLGPFLMSFRSTPGSFETPLAQFLQEILYEFLASMDRQGMPLFRPPNPAGWSPSDKWTSSATLTERLSLKIPLTAPDARSSAILKQFRHFVEEGKPRSGAAIFNRLCLLFDWDPTPPNRAIIEKVWAGATADIVSDLWKFGPRFQKTLTLIAAAPETHFC
jgi:uncharacterized protein (DUF1800 family)